MYDLPKKNLHRPANSRIRNLVYTCPVDHSGSSVYVKGWLVPETKKKPVVLVHGLSESTEDLAPFAETMTEKGFSVYGFDLSGHRHYEDKSELISKFDQLYLDLLQVVAWVKHKENGQKPIVIGHGTGALVALFFAKGYGKFCHSMVFVSPLFSMVDQVSGYRRMFLGSLDEFFPTFRPPRWISPKFTDNGRDGPLKLDNRLAYELLSAISHSRKIFQRHRLHTLIISAKEDPVAKYDFLKRLILKHKFSDRFLFNVLDTHGHHLLTGSPAILSTVAQSIDDWQKELQLQEEAANAKEEGQASSTDKKMFDNKVQSKSTETFV